MAPLTISAADEKRVKALGFLSNKGTDNFSGRIITVNGKITAAQQKCLSLIHISEPTRHLRKSRLPSSA